MSSTGSLRCGPRRAGAGIVQRPKVGRADVEVVGFVALLLSPRRRRDMVAI
jgi:hypothetical protein